MNEEYTEKHGSTELTEVRKLSLNDRFTPHQQEAPPLDAQKPRVLTRGAGFKFSCHKGLSCFNTCCSDVNIFLTPYDVLRMRRAAGLSSGEFLKRYTVALLGEEGLPLIVLKMMEDENKTCPFVTPDGCSIYEDRTWSCRMYPIFPVSSREEGFFIEEDSKCLGFKEEKQWTVEEWRRNQGIDVYDKMNESYKEITFHNYFKKGNKLDSGKAKLLYRACYDLDEFKRFLFGTRFFDIYDVEKDVIEKIKKDEEELLSFGYRWIRFNLFGEDTLKLKDKELDKLLQSKPTSRQVGTSVIPRLDRGIQTPSSDLIGGTIQRTGFPSSRETLDSLVKPENDISGKKD